MLIVIPSSGRATRQITLRALPESIRSKVHLCLYPCEVDAYAFNPGLRMVVDPEVQGIAQKRQWILDHTTDSKVVMLDDDLVFATRRSDSPTKFRASTDQDIQSMFIEIGLLLDSYAMVGVSGREGANRNTERLLENTRLMRVLAYRADVLFDEDVSAADGNVMNDFYTVLSLLTRGRQVVNINWIVQNQHGSDTTGGCSAYRTSEAQTAAALVLQAKFPRFVKVVQKETKTAWGGKPRTDVIIQWKKAYECGRKN